ncbi:MAG TPA: prepilin peptidase [candidate division Zixibacteria bacterium]|nr:prepilin peptidase [candidate division Zixibacteria bacterium]
MSDIIKIDNLVIAAAILLTLLAMHSDYRYRIIANRLTLPAIVLGVLLNTLVSGWHGLLFSLLGLFAGVGLMIIPYTLGRMGGGDVKFMGALGALLGGYSVLNIFLYTTLAGGILALIVAIFNKQLRATLKRIWLIVCAIFISRCFVLPAEQMKKSIHIPYGIAIGLGTFCYLLAGKIV